MVGGSSLPFSSPRYWAIMLVLYGMLFVLLAINPILGVLGPFAIGVVYLARDHHMPAATVFPFVVLGTCVLLFRTVSTYLVAVYFGPLAAVLYYVILDIGLAITLKGSGYDAR